MSDKWVRSEEGRREHPKNRGSHDEKRQHVRGIRNQYKSSIEDDEEFENLGLTDAQYRSIR